MQEMEICLNWRKISDTSSTFSSKMDFIKRTTSVRHRIVRLLVFDQFLCAIWILPDDRYVLSSKVIVTMQCLIMMCISLTRSSSENILINAIR